MRPIGVQSASEREERRAAGELAWLREHGSAQARCPGECRSYAPVPLAPVSVAGSTRSTLAAFAEGFRAKARQVKRIDRRRSTGERPCVEALRARLLRRAS
jgi:hypothetical protein